MWKDRYSVLRTNGLLFVSGFAFMGTLAGVGALIGPAPLESAIEPAVTLIAEADMTSLSALERELSFGAAY